MYAQSQSKRTELLLPNETVPPLSSRGRQNKVPKTNGRLNVPHSSSLDSISQTAKYSPNLRRPKTGAFPKPGPCKCKACTLKRVIPDDPKPINLPKTKKNRDASPSKVLRLDLTTDRPPKDPSARTSTERSNKTGRNKKKSNIFDQDLTARDLEPLDTVKETLKERDGTEFDFVRVGLPRTPNLHNDESPERLGTATTCCSSFMFEEIRDTDDDVTLTEEFFKFLDFSSEDMNAITLKNDCNQSDDVISSRLGSRLDTINSCMQWKRGPLLGRGAFGTVWCGLTMTGELVAVKQSEIPTADLKSAQYEYEKIQSEVAVLKSLRHENIVGYLGTCLEGRVVSIFMQFIPGGTVAGVVRKFGSLAEPVFSRYTRQLLEAVIYLHSKNVIHRDIKGSNLMLMPCGVIKLIDFGCAKRVMNLDRSNADILKSMKGTPYWMSPEVINGTGHGRKSDIWSIGCTVFEMATGRPPWSHLNKFAALYAISTGVTVPKLSEKFSDDAKDFVSKCLIRDAENRPEAVKLRKEKFLDQRQQLLDANLMIHDSNGMPRNSAVRRKVLEFS